MTNYEKIKNMSIDDMINEITEGGDGIFGFEYFMERCCTNCNKCEETATESSKDCVKKWLESEASE